LLPNITESKIFFTNREGFKRLTGHLSLGFRPGGEWVNS